MLKAVVFGAGGFIGNHLVNKLKQEGYWVRGVDVKKPEFSMTKADEFFVMDLTSYDNMIDALEIEGGSFDELYQLAADMGGADYVFTGKNDLNIMIHSALINLNLLDILSNYPLEINKIFYSSSACMYPQENQTNPNDPNCSEDSAYPANPDSEYGWEKLFSERLYLAFAREHPKVQVNIARFHNIFGPFGTYEGGKEKAPAALCRKVALADKEIEVWGDGKQTRSFLYIDDCIEGIMRLMKSDFNGPVNIGSEEMVSINELARIIIAISGKDLKIKNIETKNLGVRGRNSDNSLIRKKLGWEPTYSLSKGLEQTYNWIRGKI